MNILKYIFAVLFLSVSIVSCSDDKDDIIPVDDNPVEGLYKIYEIEGVDHLVEIYSENQTLEVGYNEFSIRIKDLGGDNYISNADLSWMPMMHMENMSHSAPHSMLSNTEEATVYTGHIVFQMASNDLEYWELNFTYTIHGQLVEGAVRVDVQEPADGFKTKQVFMGADEVRYVLAYAHPKNPQVAINDMEAVLYKMEDMMTFPVVENYTITVDPRMPGMGNHSSPNNEDLTYNAAQKRYEGKLSLTMTGYWKINMKLLNENGEVLKGEDVTEDNPSSSLYFEIEF